MHKAIHSALNIRASKTYVPYEVFESEQMLHDLLNRPEHFINHLRRYTYSVTTQVTFGFRSDNAHDANLEALYGTMRNFSDSLNATIAGLVDIYPILRRLPDRLLPSRKKFQELHKVEKNLYMKHWITSKNQIRKGTAKVSSIK